MQKPAVPVLGAAPHIHLFLRPGDPKVPELLITDNVHGHALRPNGSGSAVPDVRFRVPISTNDDFVCFVFYVTVY